MQSTRCLLVDDHALSRGLVKNVLTARGLQLVGEAATARRAVEILRSTEVDLVFLDIEMPDMPGLDLLRIIRKNRPDVKVIVVTGHALATYVHTARARGAAGFVIKPFTIGKLMATIEHVLAAPNPVPQPEADTGEEPAEGNATGPGEGGEPEGGRTGEAGAA